MNTQRLCMEMLLRAYLMLPCDVAHDMDDVADILWKYFWA